MPHAMDLCPGWWLPCFQRRLLLIFLIYTSLPESYNPSAGVIAEKQAFVNISMSTLFLILSLVCYSWLNVCFRGVLVSKYGQQLQSLKAFMQLSLVIHLHILSKALEDVTWDYCSVFSIIDAWSTNKKYIFLRSETSIFSTLLYFLNCGIFCLSSTFPVYLALAHMILLP